jgi:hypothetical protein
MIVIPATYKPQFLPFSSTVPMGGVILIPFPALDVMAERKID